jgi:hypothetical protein
MQIKHGHEIAKKVTLGLPPQKDCSLQTFSNKMPAFTKSHKMALLDLSIFKKRALDIKHRHVLLDVASGVFSCLHTHAKAVSPDPMSGLSIEKHVKRLCFFRGDSVLVFKKDS